jgi:hypothetical protein
MQFDLRGHPRFSGRESTTLATKFEEHVKRMGMAIRKGFCAVDAVRWEVNVRADPMELTAKLTK